MIRRTAPGPLFVLAPARSGSSVVCAMLGEHPRLYGFPELRVFRADTIGGLLVEPPAGQGMAVRVRTAGLVRAIAELHEREQLPAAVDRAFGWLEERSSLPVARLLEHLLELVAPMVGVEKSPETSSSDAAMRRMCEGFPRARYIHLVRHPRATVASMVDTWRQVPWWNVPSQLADEHCLEVWYRHHQRIAAFGAGIPPARFLRVRAEDIVNRPTQTLPTICRWLGIEAGDEPVRRMMAPESSCYATPGPSNAPGGLDPSFLTHPRLRPLEQPQSLMPPRSPTCDPSLWAAAARLAESFGYGAQPAVTEPAQVYRLRRRRRPVG